MIISNATFIVSVNEKFLPFLKLLKGNFEKSGVRYELFIISNLSTPYDFSDLKPKMVLETNSEKFETEILNDFLLSISTSNIFIIQEPFLCSDNWAKDNIHVKDNLLNIGVLTIPFNTYYNNFNLTHTLNKNFDLEDICALNKNIYCGLTIISLDTVKMLGAFNTDFPIVEAILEYSIRATKLGYQNYSSLNFITPIYDKIESIEISEILENANIHIPLKTFSPIEEMAYHDLDNFLHTNKLDGQKFYLEFSGVFGFRCSSINSILIKNINSFSKRFNLSYEIKSIFLEQEQKLNRNIWIMFSEKR
jgi:hypothetical protein